MVMEHFRTPVEVIYAMEPLRRVRSFKYLGVTLDDRGTLELHMEDKRKTIKGME